jgi:hypothetical protein
MLLTSPVHAGGSWELVCVLVIVVFQVIFISLSDLAEHSACFLLV